MRPTLIFVYNADSGLFNTVTDIAHKLLSPQTYACTLCALTHGHFKVREEWVQFLETLDVDCVFLHRDEFHATYAQTEVLLPAIFRTPPEGAQLWIDADTLRQCASLDELKQLLVSRLAQSTHR